MPLGVTSSIDIVFEPTPDTRADYVSGATSRRTWSWVTMGIGAALGGGGLAVALVEHNRLQTDQTTLNGVNADRTRFGGGVCDVSKDMSVMYMGQVLADYCQNQVTNATSNVNNDQTWQTVGWVATAVGGAVLVTGLVLLATGNDPHKYDEKPSEKLLGDWQLMPVVGSRGASLSAVREF